MAIARELTFAAKPAFGWGGLAAGLALCAAIMVVAELLGAQAPVVGAPLFAIAIGVAAANTVLAPAQLKALRVGDIGKMCLKIGIVLLGASLNLADILQTGLQSLPVLLATLAAGFIAAFGIGWLLGVEWRMRCLIGIGTTICGASAIAALSPVVRAKAEEIAYAISVIFLFNMIAVFAFPAIGHLLALGNQAFGLWTGTAVNDTSAVVAAGFSYSHAAGAYATIVKLTRTTLIIPLVLGFGLLMPILDRSAGASDTSLIRRVWDTIPLFIVLFVLASLAQTVGLFGDAAPQIELVGRWVMVMALAAVGLQGYWRAFVGAGPRPLLLGLVTWVAVAVTSLAVQHATGTL